jgi:hypothetical protein
VCGLPSRRTGFDACTVRSVSGPATYPHRSPQMSHVASASMRSPLLLLFLIVSLVSDLVGGLACAQLLTAVWCQADVVLSTGLALRCALAGSRVWCAVVDIYCFCAAITVSGSAHLSRLSVQRGLPVLRGAGGGVPGVGSAFRCRFACLRVCAVVNIANLAHCGGACL